jgi:hypothetical protein
MNYYFFRLFSFLVRHIKEKFFLNRMFQILIEYEQQQVNPYYPVVRADCCCFGGWGWRGTDSMDACTNRQGCSLAGRCCCQTSHPLAFPPFPLQLRARPYLQPGLPGQALSGDATSLCHILFFL